MALIRVSRGSVFGTRLILSNFVEIGRETCSSFTGWYYWNYPFLSFVLSPFFSFFLRKKIPSFVPNDALTPRYRLKEKRKRFCFVDNLRWRKQSSDFSFLFQKFSKRRNTNPKLMFKATARSQKIWGPFTNFFFFFLYPGKFNRKSNLWPHFWKQS